MIRYIIGLMIIFMAACQGDNDEEITLKLNPEIGQTYPMNMSMHMLMTAMGMETAMDMKIFFDLHIEDIKDDTLFITATYNRVTFDQNIPMIGTIEYDSDVPASESNQMAAAMQELFGTLVNRPFNLKLNRQGQVISTGGFDTLTAGGSALAETATSRAQISELIGNLLAYLPEQPVRKGDTWSREMARTGQVPIIIETEYTVHRIKSNEVILKIQGDIMLNEESKESENVSELNGTYSGTLTLNRNTAWTEAANMQQDINMTMMESGTSISMSMENDIEFEIRED